MKLCSIFRGLLSVILTEVLFLLLPFPAAAQAAPQYQLYFGLLHAHTDISGAEGTAEVAFTQASAVEGLDFFAVTDHSNSFENANDGAIGLDGTSISADWAAGKAAAATATSETFVGIFGYEMTFRDSDGFGHINTFCTPGWQSRNQEAFDTLAAYYDALTTVPDSISQFNHPGTDLGDFQAFSHWTEAYDKAVSLLEVGSENGVTAYDTYIAALDKGWHVAPTNSQNNHHGQFGTASNVRTVLLADALTEESLYDAMRNRRAYATEDKDLRIEYTLNGACLGSILPFQETVSITAAISDATDPAIGTLEVVTNGGEVLSTQEITGSSETVTLSLPGKGGYYFLRITQTDKDIAVTAPIWLEEPEVPELPTEPEESVPEETAPEETQPQESIPEESLPEESIPDTEDSFPEDLDVEFYFGLLHAHTDLSDGIGSVEEAFAKAASLENMDFFAVTDHSNSFDNADSGAIGIDGCSVSEAWARGKAAAENATSSDFLALFGYEMTWTDDRNLGHINTFGTPDWQSRNQEGFNTLEAYYEALSSVPGSVSQFNHPGPGLGDFENFTHHSAGYAAAVSLLEIADPEGFGGYDAYITALDNGWHVAPTASHNDHEGDFGSLSSCRTVILAHSLTEDALYEAMLAHRVYATGDADLSVYYTLDDAAMGSTRNAKETHTLQVFLHDPTDNGTASVSVITDGGRTVASGDLSENGTLTLSIPGGGNYYFLRITQSDGDTAVTAPVWTESYQDVGIAAFTSDTEVPVPGHALTLTLEIYNDEAVDFQLHNLTISAGGTPVYQADNPGTVPAGETLTIAIPYSQTAPGIVTLQALMNGTVGGVSHSPEAELTLRFRAKEMTKGILVDLGHSSHSPEDFSNLETLAGEVNMTVTFFHGDFNGAGSTLILPPPEQPYEAAFLQQVKIFCARGGTLVVCGCSDRQNPHAAGYLNQLLQTVGSSILLRSDTALDEIHNGGSGDLLYPTAFNTDTFWCENITTEQYYVHLSGSTVEPGQGIWLVKGSETAHSSREKTSTPALLVWEKQASGAHILASGSLFLSDNAMPLPKNLWDPGTGNQTILEALLGITREEFPVTAISDLRKGRPGTLYHIQGYTTSGTSNRYNTFPDTIYLQDDTGGIAITPFRETGIPVGTAMVAAGYLDQQDGNPVLVPVDYDFPAEKSCRYVPETRNHSRLLDYDTYGGQLVQAEANVTSVTLTEDGQGIRRFTLTDAWGDQITVMIEDTIFSGAYGTNTLASEVKIGRTVRAMGLLHLDNNGIPVIRVRNCEEVVWVPPVPRPGSKTNPYTGDQIGIWAATLSVSLCGIFLLSCRRKARSDG